MSDKIKDNTIINAVNVSEQNIEKLEAIYKELGITGCSFLRNLKSEDSFEKGVEHALSMLTSYKAYLENAKKGSSENTERLRLVSKVTSV